MTNAERAIIGAAVLTATMAVLYVVGRVRAGDFDARRDVLRVVILLATGAAAAALFSGPEILVLVVFPGLLILGGTYLVRTRSDRFTRTVGWATLALGAVTAVQALIRIFVLR